LRAVDLAAAHAHRVDYGGAASGDIVAVAYAAGRLPADVLSEVGARLLDEIEQGFGLVCERLGRAAEAADSLDRHVAFAGDGRDSLSDRAFGFGLYRGVTRSHV